MKVKNIDLKNKVFCTEDEETFPFVFDVDESVTLDEFQEIVSNSQNAIETLIHKNG